MQFGETQVQLSDWKRGVICPFMQMISKKLKNELGSAENLLFTYEFRHMMGNKETNKQHSH